MQRYNHIIINCQQIIFTILLLAFVTITTYAQQRLPNRGGDMRGGAAMQGQHGEGDSKKVDIEPHVKAWIMIDDMTLADTIPVDTLLNLHQMNNPIWKNNVMNVTLGVLGSPSQSRFFPTIRKHDGNIFYNSILDYIPQAEQMVFFNTLTPYTNLTYQMGYPKRRSEEYVHALFTQNINKRANVGFQYALSTSIGMYQSQRTDQSKFRLWNSYDGDYYRYYLNMQYNHSEINENGGLVNMDDVLTLHDKEEEGKKKYDKAEDMPVQLTSAMNKQSVYELRLSHSLDLGHITRLDKDSNEVEIAPAVAHHTMSIHKNHSHFTISDLVAQGDTMFTKDRYIDRVKTHDNRKYFEFKNEFELKMTEDFNSLLRFGIRAFVGVDVRRYRTEMPNDTITDEETGKKTPIFRSEVESKVSSYFGGQIFKNVGENLRWKAGIRTYFGKYRNGNIEANGEVNISFPLLGHETDFYGKAWFETHAPEFYEEKYFSNHYKWNKSFDDYKSLKFESGIKLPDLRLKLYAFGGVLSDWIYFGEDCTPEQLEDDIKVIGVYGEKHFSVIGFNSIVRLAWQKSSKEQVMALPQLSLEASNFYERLFFDVLLLQVGFDVRYNSDYYAPKYAPALMQYCAQGKRKVGDYGFFDPFINFHLKRARVYLKYDHVNSLWGSTDYFHTLDYAAAPAMFKFGLSWNFYD
ncbi:MAG: putative porin [Bacteroidia bacterium]|nr:putative porin [Bacteroidia bacterium]